MHRRSIFLQVIRDYMMQTTLHGYRYLAEPGRHWIERALWILVHISTTTCVCIIVYGMYDQYMIQRPVTTVSSVHFPIQRVPFPAIAICDVNKLRKSRTLDLAARLYREYNVSVSEERFAELLRNLGVLYDQSEQTDLASVIELEDVLHKANIHLDIDEVMAELTTTCDELLVNCKWESQEDSCAELFSFRKTMEGYCCTFNYIRPTDDLVIKPGVLLNQSRTSPTAGAHMGLTVLVNTNESDYYYPLIPIVGLKVLIYNPTDYPDTVSGGLTELLVTPGDEAFFSLSAITTNATEAVKRLSNERRNCYFSDDQSSKFGAMYSYSDCLVDCRVESTRKLCGCLPFFAPVRETTRTCGLSDIACLRRYRDIWQTLKPKGSNPETIDKSESLFWISCDICVAACTTTLYVVQSSSMPLSQTLIDNSGAFPTVDIESHSVVRIYFGSSSTSLMKTDVLTTWFELLSNIGGICGVFVGFSLMSIVEFVYFFTVRLALQIWGNKRQRTAPLEQGGHGSSNRIRDVAVVGQTTLGQRVLAWEHGRPPARALPFMDYQTRKPMTMSWYTPEVNIHWNEIHQPKITKRGRRIKDFLSTLGSELQ